MGLADRKTLRTKKATRTASRLAKQGTILRVAVDIDNTIIVNDTVWRKFFQTQRAFNRCEHRIVHDDEVSQHWDYWMHVCAPCFELALTSPQVLGSHRVRPGVRQVMDKYTSRGVEFHLVTARNRKFTEATTRKWLLKNKICPPNRVTSIVYGSASTKPSICITQGFDIIIDDEPGTIESAFGTGLITTILMTAPWNERIGVPTHYRVRNWKEVDRILEGEVAVRKVVADVA